MTDIEAMKRRRREIRAQGSPPFREQPAIDAGETYLYAPAENSRAAKYFPFDELEVINQSTAVIQVELEQRGDRTWTIGDSAARTLDNIQPFRSYRVVNISNADDIDAGDLTITARRQPWDSDKQAQHQLQSQDMDKLLRLGGLLI